MHALRIILRFPSRNGRKGTIVDRWKISFFFFFFFFYSALKERGGTSCKSGHIRGTVSSFLAKFHSHGRNKEDSFVLCALLCVCVCVAVCFQIGAYGFRVANSRFEFEAETSFLLSRRDG